MVIDNKRKKSVVLITFYDLDSFALHTLHAVLKRAGSDVHSVFFKNLNINSTADYATDDDIAALVKLLKQLDPMLVGISFRSTYFKLAIRISQAIKKQLDVLTVWGGYPPNNQARAMYRVRGYCLRGRGRRRYY